MIHDDDNVLFNSEDYERVIENQERNIDNLKIAVSILSEERNRLNGVPGYTLEEVFADVDRVIDDARAGLL